MGSYFQKEKKKENEYIKQIKEVDIDVDEINNHILNINHKVIVMAMKEVINEIEELQSKDKERIHLVSPKLDCMNFSII